MQCTWCYGDFEYSPERVLIQYVGERLDLPVADLCGNCLVNAVLAIEELRTDLDLCRYCGTAAPCKNRGCALGRKNLGK